jgi:hypothetical protein
MAVILASGATMSLAATIGKGAIWSQVCAVVLMAPATVAGGWLRRRVANAADLRAAVGSGHNFGSGHNLGSADPHATPIE